MKEKAFTLDRGKRYLFYILMIAILGWFLFMQFFGADERSQEMSSGPVIYSGTFIWQKSDGTSEKITVPGKYKVPAGETMVLISQLPDTLQETDIAIRSSLQDVNVYINNELRTSYSTRETRLAGKNSASRYIFCPVSSSDAGKQLRIELTTYTSNYSGVVNTIYCGNKSDIWLSIFAEYGLSTGIAFFILFSGIISILFSFALGMVYKKRFDMEYLGWCMVMGAIWMLGESKMRQLLVPNASALGSLCFVMILLSPLPIILYADSIQKEQHHRSYACLGWIALANFAACSVLAVTKKADYMETLPVGQLLLAFTLILIFIHLFQYIRAGQNKADRILLLGLLTSIICTCVEGISVYFVTSLSGIFMGIGMLILLFVNIIRTLKNVQDTEIQRHQIELEKRRKQTEKMSLQMMQTLSTTIEAKDEYTRGHSYRVAEYAALIASELGWSPEEIQVLKHSALLHDIGKIGIPDSILNKPSRLTDDEYSLIKKHPVIGAEILKDVTLLPHVLEVTRGHHERYDGNGYPDGLAGKEIPVHARIVAMADSYDAMSSRRIYRSALSRDVIYEEIRKNRGLQFDPEITDIFLKLMDENRLPKWDSDSEDTDSYNFPDMQLTVSKFISDVVTTIKAQADTKNYDFLTGLPMRSLGERLAAELMQEHNGCLIFLDMDNLKRINDIYGHTAGDRALKLLGNMLAKYTGHGIASRLGGDEFLIFMPDVSHEAVAEQMHKLFQEFHSIIENDVEIQCATLSAGLCMCTCEDSFESCYLKADKTLYYVKQNGKNQFFFYQQMDRRDLSNSSVGKNLKLIANSLRESGSYRGALDLNYRDFARHYEYMSQLVNRSNCRCYLVMVTMETVIDTLPNIEAIEHALKCMEQAICEKIRRVDICTRYSSMQYLIILFEPIETQIPNIMERISLQYYRQCSDRDFHPIYEYLSMIDEKQP